MRTARGGKDAVDPGKDAGDRGKGAGDRAKAEEGHAAAEGRGRWVLPRSTLID